MNREFAAALEEWYDVNGRDLPWRHTRNPYLIWVSEIILQQTRVAQGMDYYRRFVERFPDFGQLAAASEVEVMRMWQGLGYYSRARHLHAAARMMAQAGCFPSTYAGVRALPGVGDYTAAAICSIAYGLPYAVLDGNVFRVLARHFLIDEPIDTTRGRKVFRAMADEMLDTSSPGLFNQAIMDFGALQCVPGVPDCLRCPLCDTCMALRHGRVRQLPVKERSVRVRNRYLTYFYVRDAKGRVYLRRRPEGDIWQGLYELYGTVADQPCSLDEAATLFPGCRLTCCTSRLKHQLTHQTLYADCYLVEGYAGSLPEEGEWVPENGLDSYPMPRLMERLLETVSPAGGLGKMKKRDV